MNTMKIPPILFLIVIISAHQILFAQYAVNRTLFNVSGNQLENNSFIINVTIGQSAIGAMQGSEYNSNFGFWYSGQGTLTDIADNLDLIPKEYKLEQNYPNPFNPSTKIKFGLPKESKVVLLVYNILGEKVVELIDQDLSAGYHEIELFSSNLSSGIYIYTLHAEKFIKTKKMLVLK